MAKLSRIAPELPVHDLRDALEFYEQKLGFQVSMQMTGYAIVERDDVAIHLFCDGASNQPPVGIHIFTGDLQGLCSELKQRGASLSQEIARKPWGNRDFRVKDAFGNELKFTEPLAD